MNFITIEHKNGAITLSADLVDYICYRSRTDCYYVILKGLDDLVLTKEQHDKLVERFTY